jgi:thiamine biosynthesis protein ThiS
LQSDEDVVEMAGSATKRDEAGWRDDRREDVNPWSGRTWAMKVHLQLFSILRDKLPKEARGEAVLDLAQGATVADLLQKLDIQRNVVVSINDVHEPDRTRSLQDGDDIKIFSSVGGG